MKKLALALSALGIIFAVSSCKNTELTKRHYTKGYYVHKSKSLEKPAIKESFASLIKDDNTQQTESLSPHAASLNNPSQPALRGGLTTNNSHTAPVIKENKLFADKVNTGSDVQHDSAKHEFTKPANKVVSKKSASGNPDTNTIILVILALFPILSLIAVYLHDGKRITLNFWITLLLHLTFIGYAIFAVLVVLDVVNLA